MKKENWIWVVVGLLIAALLFVLFQWKCNSPKSTIPLTNDSTSVTHWVLENGKLAASLRQTEEALSNAETDIDSMAALLKTKPKFIKEIVTITQKGDVEIKTVDRPVIVRDTIDNSMLSASQTFRSPYYIADVFIPLTGQDSSTMALLSWDTLTVITKQVLEGNLFSPKRSIQIDAINANPHNVITGITAYRVPLPKTSRWSKFIKPLIVAGIAGYIGYKVAK